MIKSFLPDLIYIHTTTCILW